jgi:hypothetical protein
MTTNQSIATVMDDFIDRIMIDPGLNANPRVAEAHHRVSLAGFKYHRGEVHRGEHEPILARDLFEAAQAGRVANAVARQLRLRGSAAPLSRFFDDRGNRMSPTHANKDMSPLSPLFLCSHFLLLQHNQQHTPHIQRSKRLRRTLRLFLLATSAGVRFFKCSNHFNLHVIRSRLMLDRDTRVAWFILWSKINKSSYSKGGESENDGQIEKATTRDWCCAGAPSGFRYRNFTQFSARPEARGKSGATVRTTRTPISFSRPFKLRDLDDIQSGR